MRSSRMRQWPSVPAGVLRPRAVRASKEWCGEGAARPDGVAVGVESIELLLQLLDRVCSGLFGEPVFGGLLEALLMRFRVSVNVSGLCEIA